LQNQSLGYEKAMRERHRACSKIWCERTRAWYVALEQPAWAEARKRDPRQPCAGLQAITESARRRTETALVRTATLDLICDNGPKPADGLRQALAD